MVDTLVEMKKKNCKAISKYGIECPSSDMFCEPGLLPLRVFVRSFMTKSDNLVASKYPEE